MLLVVERSVNPLTASLLIVPKGRSQQFTQFLTQRCR